MASITIRNLDDDVKTRLRTRAAGNGRSMEEEARLILREAVGRKPASQDLASIIRAREAGPGGLARVARRRREGSRWPALAARDRDRGHGHEGCEGPLHARVRATTALACGA